MKSLFFSRTILVPLIFLIACQAQTATVIPSPTATATITSSPSATSTPTPDPGIISLENANQLVLKFINMGKAQGSPVFSLDGKWLYQQSTAGTYAFDAVSYQDVHLLASTPVQMLIPNAQTFTGLEALTGYAVYEQSIFSPDGSLIAGYFHSDLTTVGRLEDGKLINQFDGYPLEISADNRLILIGRSVTHETASHATYTVYYMDLYDLQSGEEIGSWSGRRAFFLSDNRLAVESSEGYTRIFDPLTRKARYAFPGWYATFSPDEQNVAVLYGNQIHIYQVADGKILRKFDSGLPSTDAATLRFSGNGEILAGFTTEYYCCAGYSNRLFVWQVSDGNLLADLSQPEMLGQYAEPPISLSQDGQTIVIDSRVIRISDRSLIKDLRTYFIDAVTNLAFTSDGQKLTVLDTSGQVHLYPVDGGMFSLPQNADPETYLPLLQPVPGISSERVIDAHSPDGKIVARGLQNGSVELWDVQSKQKIFTLPPRTGDNSNPVRGLAFSPDGKLLAVGLLDGTVRLYGLNAK